MLWQTVGYALGKRLGALILATVVLWPVAMQRGQSNGQAIVHVSTTNVDVAVDDAVYHIESLYQTPVVCELRPGCHVARLLREGQVVYEEEFTITTGEDTILSAWDGYDDGRSPQQGRMSSSRGDTARLVR